MQEGEVLKESCGRNNQVKEKEREVAKKVLENGRLWYYLGEEQTVTDLYEIVFETVVERTGILGMSIRKSVY
jgi:hypothetical protein